jgi:ferredoxin-NADP reductase
MEHKVKILEIIQVTHNVKCFRIEKPAGFTFIPGQATDVSVNKPGWENEKRPFTFTCLNEDPYLEFTIKGYYDHDGVTKKLHSLNIGDEIIIRDVWGAIAYKGEGYFIAGGAGITPFIAILRQLYKDKNTGSNKLIFSNKTSKDIIYEVELNKILGKNLVNILSQEDSEGQSKGHIDEAFIKKQVTDFSKHFYVCGPDKMIADITATLNKLGANAEAVVFEK